MRIIFLFSSLIQSLIIVSLVLFLIYGQPEQSAEEKRVKELEVGFNKLSDNNIQLRKEKSELGKQLGACKAEKLALVKSLEKLQTESKANESALQQRIEACERKALTPMPPRPNSPPMINPVLLSANNEMKVLQTLNAQQKEMIGLIRLNFTNMVRYLRGNNELATRDRDKYLHQTIALRRNNTMLQEQFMLYTSKCKQDFAHSLDGIKTVTTTFLNKINNLFPHQMTFHLTCERQREDMEKIRTSCTNLSKDVENKFQAYLDKVGDKVAEILAQSSHLEVTNTYLTSDLTQCEQTKEAAAADAAKQRQVLQTAHDDQMERLLLEKKQLRDDKTLLEHTLALKEKEQQQCLAALQTRSASKPASPGAPDLSKAPKVR
ncbi:unnamed protein product [Tetraodon nigroviridis]|uniref:(spotted green pufferfish) hypothetical protein n=1 Tax=Tetraodon nigroviridis TaxID=99883 RepID=Q4SF22_TETNG|nr:unnamed protein product [Tetraodon nigroviridis]